MNLRRMLALLVAIGFVAAPGGVLVGDALADDEATVTTTTRQAGDDDDDDGGGSVTIQKKTTDEDLEDVEDLDAELDADVEVGDSDDDD